ncbi:MAG TPA: (d)CMP kinase [Pseudomonadales bacterium]
MSKVPVIAVDGPSGSGKGTLAARLARALQWHLLDSGALYRAVAWTALARSTALDNDAALAKLARRLNARFEVLGDDDVRVSIDGVDASLAIREERVGVTASRVAALPPVRAALLRTQHDFRRAPGLVADGRDMGTVVFTDAKLKIFLDASAEERAQRRYKQLKDKDLGVSLAALLESIRERDERDRSRAVSPLVPAADAVVIDSSSLSIDAVFEKVWQLVSERGLTGVSH